MKKLTLLAFLIVIGSCSFFSARADRKPAQETVFVPLIKTMKPHSHPRSANTIPLECIYNKAALRFHFYEDIGCIYITIINHSTGEQWADIVDSSDGQAEIPISDTEGDYSVTIETENRECYSGGFTL